jgi:hypothetical protein
MKKILFWGIAIICMLFLSCQKSQPPEAKKEVQTQEEEIKEPQTIQKRSEDQLKQQAQKPILQEAKEEKKQIPFAKEPSPLTEEEQKEFERFGGNWETPSVFKNEKEAIRYLKILLKGNEKTIRWYQNLAMTGKSKEEAERRRKWRYSDNIATALDAINTETSKEGFKLAVEVLRTKREYPEALAKAALVVKFAHDPSVISILREIVNYPIPSVRLQVAGSLLSLGEADTALPVLDELAEKEGYTGALYYLFRGPGKIIDERGYKILEKALNFPRAEVRISATKLLLESKKIQKEKAEEIGTEILNKLKTNTLKNYGLKLDPNEIYKIIPLSDMKPHELGKATDLERSDSRACEYAMILLAELKSKKAIPILKYIDSNNSGISCICRSKNARNALKAIEEGRK